VGLLLSSMVSESEVAELSVFITIVRAEVQASMSVEWRLGRNEVIVTAMRGSNGAPLKRASRPSLSAQLRRTPSASLYPVAGSAPCFKRTFCMDFWPAAPHSPTRDGSTMSQYGQRLHLPAYQSRRRLPMAPGETNDIKPCRRRMELRGCKRDVLGAELEASEPPRLVFLSNITRTELILL